MEQKYQIGQRVKVILNNNYSHDSSQEFHIGKEFVICSTSRKINNTIVYQGELEHNGEVYTFGFYGDELELILQYDINSIEEDLLELEKKYEEKGCSTRTSSKT